MRLKMLKKKYRLTRLFIFSMATQWNGGNHLIFQLEWSISVGMANTRGNMLESPCVQQHLLLHIFSLFRRRAHEAWDGQASMSWGSRWCGIHCQWYHTWTRYRNTLTSCTPVLTLWVLRMISMKFLLVISMLYKTEWSWELRTWSQKINLIHTSTTFPHYFHREPVGATNENLNFDIRV